MEAKFKVEKGENFVLSNFFTIMNMIEALTGEKYKWYHLGDEYYDEYIIVKADGND